MASAFFVVEILGRYVERFGVALETSGEKMKKHRSSKWDFKD